MIKLNIFPFEQKLIFNTFASLPFLPYYSMEYHNDSKSSSKTIIHTNIYNPSHNRGNPYYLYPDENSNYVLIAPPHIDSTIIA